MHAQSKYKMHAKATKKQALSCRRLQESANDSQSVRRPSTASSACKTLTRARRLQADERAAHGRVLALDGAVVHRDGRVLLDGAVVHRDSRVLLLDGAVVDWDGRVLLDGAVVDRNGRVLAEGALVGGSNHFE